MIEKFVKYISDKNRDYVIFDVGSRDCKQSIEFYKTFPNAKIYAFECNPNTLPICETNIIPYQDRITLIKGAVCDYDGNITFFPINQEKTRTTWKDGNPDASSIFKSNNQYTIEKYVQNEITTNCHRLDTVMQKIGISRVDIIWMDLQGAELLALKGLGNQLSKVEYMHTEVSHKAMYTGQVMYKELDSFITKNGFELQNSLSLHGWQEDAIYKKIQSYSIETKEEDTFDIVIPVGPNDKSVIEEQIGYTRKNIIGYRNIYLIAYDESLSIDGCITVDESRFPFSKETVEKYHGKLERNGWYLQQLFKLYAGNIISDILDTYLVIDSDTRFLKPTTFLEKGKCLYNYGTEYHKPYFEHMGKLDDSLTKIRTNMSGICHHMMFQTKYVDELMSKIEDNHKDTFYNIFLKSVTHKSGSGASEYELYFNFMLKYHPESIKIRKLKWKNGQEDQNDLDYVSCHWYMR